MRLCVISDLHLEFYKNFPQIVKNADLAVLAGDIGKVTCDNFKLFFRYMSHTFKKIIYVPGNHEYYDKVPICELKQMYKDTLSEFPNVSLLDNDTVEYNGYRFIGSTLWSNPESVKGLNDFNMIHKKEEYDTVPISIYDFKAMHAESKDFIKKELAKDDMPKILVTHFPPLRDGTSHPKYFPPNPYFANTLEDLNIDLKNIKAWISGHTHYSYNFEKDGIRYLSNQVGYPREDADAGFKDEVFEI